MGSPLQTRSLTTFLTFSGERASAADVSSFSPNRKPTVHDLRASNISSKLSHNKQHEPSWVKMMGNRNEAIHLNKRYEDHKAAHNPAHYYGTDGAM